MMYMNLVLQRRELLLTALMCRAQQQQLTTAELSEQLHMTEDQFLALILGIERVENIGADTARAMATYLHWPVVGVWFAAGALRLEDFFTRETLQQTVERAHARWPELRLGTALCAVLALALAGEELLPGHWLRAAVEEQLR